MIKKKKNLHPDQNSWHLIQENNMLKRLKTNFLKCNNIQINKYKYKLKNNQNL